MSRIKTIVLLLLIIIAIGIVAVATRTPDGGGSSRAARDADPAADTATAGGRGTIPARLDGEAN